MLGATDSRGGDDMMDDGVGGRKFGVSTFFQR